MNTIKLGLIGDEASASFLAAYMNTPLGSGANVFVKKGHVVDGEQVVLEITSSQWQADCWLEIKNSIIKQSAGFMFICRPSGSALKLRTIRKIIYSVLKVRDKVPLVVVSNELVPSGTASSFDDHLIHLQALFSTLRCPILRTTATKNDRMLNIMFAELCKLVKKHDYSHDPYASNLTDYESTIIRETDTSEDFFGHAPVVASSQQEQLVPHWTAEHPSIPTHVPVPAPLSQYSHPQASLLSSPGSTSTTHNPLSISSSNVPPPHSFAPSHTTSAPSHAHLPTHVPPLSHSSPLASLSSPALQAHHHGPSHSAIPPALPHSPSLPVLPHTPAPPLSSHSLPHYTAPLTPPAAHAPQPPFLPTSPSLQRIVQPRGSTERPLAVPTEIPRRGESLELKKNDSPHRQELHDLPRRTESPLKIASESDLLATKLASPRVRDAGLSIHESKADRLAHLHEKLATTLVKSEKSNQERLPSAERLLHYSDIPALRNVEVRNVDAPVLQFKHQDKEEDGANSPWDDSFNSEIGSRTLKTRRETDTSKGSFYTRNPRPRKFPPISPPHTPSPALVLPSSSATDQAEDVLDDIVSPEVKAQRAFLQQQMVARKAMLDKEQDKESELEEITLKIVIIGGPKSGKSSFIENIAQIASSYAVYKEGTEEGISVYFDRHLQKNWKCILLEPAHERKVAFQMAMSSADAFVIVYNMCSRQSFELIPAFFQDIFDAKGDLRGPIMLVGMLFAETRNEYLQIPGTRLDEVHSREVAREEGQKAAQTHGTSVIFQEISSKSHQNVHSCFPSLLNSFLLRKFKPLSPKGTGNVPPLFIKMNSFDSRKIIIPHSISAPSTPTASSTPQQPFSTGTLHESTELSKSFALDSSSTVSTASSISVSSSIGKEGKSSGKVLSHLCQSMREANSGLKRKKKQFFTGADAMEWFVLKTPQASPQDAESWCQKLLTGGYIRPIIMVDASDVSISIDGTRSKFLGGDELYLFDGDSSAANRVLNDRRVTSPARPTMDICHLCLDIPYHSLHRFLRVKHHHYQVNFRGWENSPFFDTFSLLAAELQRVDFSQIKDEKFRLAFWINVHNILAMHSCATFGPPCKEKKRKNFFDALYQVGDANIVSLLDIAHGILRNNAKIPGTSKRQFPDEDSRIQHVLSLDPRIHFALWHGTKSSPFFGIYGEDDVLVLLQYATFKYLDREVEMSYQKNFITLPKVFSTYANDFGKASFFNTEKAKLLKCIMHQDPDIRYKEYDWTATPPELLLI